MEKMKKIIRLSLKLKNQINILKLLTKKFHRAYLLQTYQDHLNLSFSH